MKIREKFTEKPFKIYYDEESIARRTKMIIEM